RIAAFVRLLGLRDRAARLAHEAQLARLEIRGNVEVGLEHAQLAHRRPAYAARRQVGDTAVGELDARVGDVDVARQYAESAGADVDRLGARQRTGQIDVMDHEIEHDVDVRAALLEAGEALRLDARRPVHARHARAERAVVALDVARLQHEL